MANCVALLEGGADPNTRAPEANTALQTAVFWSQVCSVWSSPTAGP